MSRKGPSAVLYDSVSGRGEPMWMLDAIPQMGVFAVLTLIIGLVPLAMALAYVANPSERRLALMRPLSLAGIFGALTGVFCGFIAVLRGIGATSTLTSD